MIKYLATQDGRCVGCLACVAACSRLYSGEENPSRSRIVVETSPLGTFHLIVCDQACEACLNECPARAIYRGKSGALLIDSEKCVGCLACVAACPIGAMLWHPGSRAPFKCVSCGACVRTCPKGALGMVSKEGSA